MTELLEVLRDLPPIVQAAIGYTAFLLILFAIVAAEDGPKARAARRHRAELEQTRREANDRWRPNFTERNPS